MEQGQHIHYILGKTQMQYKVSMLMFALDVITYINKVSKEVHALLKLEFESVLEMLLFSFFLQSPMRLQHMLQCNNVFTWKYL